MTDYVRARVPREGAEDLSRTTSRQRAQAAGWDLLDEPTHAHGRIRPDTTIKGRAVKPKTSVAEAATEKAAKSAKKKTDNPPSEEN